MSIFTARKVTHDRVYEEAMRLAFPTNGRYTNDDAQRFTLGLSRILRSTYNPDGAGDGMASLLRSSTDTTNPSRISGLQSTHTITATAILLQAAADAKAANEAVPKPDPAVEPDFATRAEAQDESDRINEATQAVIGAKEAIAKAITTKAGTRITDAILRTTDGQDHKSIDEFELHKLVSALMQGAERTAISEVREGIIDVLGTEFNLRRHFATNVAALRADINKLVAYGIVIPDGIIATIILAEADRAANSSGGKQVDRALSDIRLRYAYNHRHDTTSINDIVRYLTAADNVRNLADAPGPNSNNNPGQANAVDAAMDHVRRLVFDDESSDDDDTFGTAAAASTRSGYESDRSDRSYASKARGEKKTKKAGRKPTKAPAEEHTAANNPCKYCRRHGRRSRHPTVDGAKCFWNKRYKGWRPRYVCRGMDMKYHDREYFMSDTEDTSDDE